MRAVALDVFGTLVDPLEMDEHLEPIVEDNAAEMSALWRQKQLEYTFRLGLMETYRDFGFCTERALDFAAASFGVKLAEQQKEALISAYLDLRAFPDVIPGIERLRSQNRTVVAFSNGVEATTRRLLDNADILSHLDDVISVDDVKTFKPSPRVYEYLCERLGLVAGEICVVSSNPFDVTGAKSCGLETAWVRRSDSAVFDPWDIEPDIVVGDLEELAQRLA